MPEALAGRLRDVLHFIQLSQLSPIIFDDEEGHEDVAIPPGARCDQVPWPRVLAPDVSSRGHNHDCGSHGNAGYRKHRAGSAGARDTLEDTRPGGRRPVLRQGPDWKLAVPVKV